MAPVKGYHRQGAIKNPISTVPMAIPAVPSLGPKSKLRKFAILVVRRDSPAGACLPAKKTDPRKIEILDDAEERSNQAKARTKARI